MRTGEVACGTLEEMERLTNEGVKITGFEICQKLTGENRNQQFVDLIKKFKNLGIIENYTFFGKDEIGHYNRLSDIGKNTVEKIKNTEMRKYFIVAITIYCNQNKISSKELCEILSETDSFKSGEEVMEIIYNFQGMFGLEERSIMIEGTNKCKPAMEIDETAFYVFFTK